MARTSDTADYMVTQCQACGMLNVIPREYQTVECVRIVPEGH
jgi:hypothetical protein